MTMTETEQMIAENDVRLNGLLPSACLEGQTLWIGGEWSEAASAEIFTTLNPATGQPLLAISRGDASDIDRAAKAARDAGPTWLALGGSERGAILRRAAVAIRENSDDLGLLDTLDSGRPISDTAGGSAEHAAGLFDYYAGLADKIHGSVVPMGSDATALVEREPCGVVGAISPWNYPLQNAVTKIAPILACGNTMVLKPAEQTSLSALLLAQLMHDAGLPAGVLNVVTGFGSEAGAALVEHPLVSKISFTGSTAIGRRIAAAAGQELKSVVLELGGKSPMIVFEDADLQAAAEAAVFSTFMNGGQTCTSCNRVLVARPVLERFHALCRTAAEKLRIGDPLEPSNQIGPLVSALQLNRVKDLLGELGGNPLDASSYRPVDGGYFIQPVIVLEFDFESRFAREEIFGPVMSLRAFDTDVDAYRLANDTEYGLAASVWTTSLARSEQARRRLQVGIVWINCVHTLSAGTPVSGHKASGLGIEYGLEAVEQYMRVKTTVTMHGGWKSPFA
jgi:aldehyde dehydrogenase (NAD+)